MRFLKKVYPDDTTRFIPLDGATFEFKPAGNQKFEVYIISNGQSFCISEGRHIYNSLDSVVKRVMEVKDGAIITPLDLW